MYDKKYKDVSEKTLIRPDSDVIWHPLVSPWVKLNFDASFHQTNTRSASGVVARNSDDRVLAIK